MALKWLIKKSGKLIPSLIFVSALNGIYAFTSVAFALLCRGIIDSAVSHNRKQLMIYGTVMFGAIAVALTIRILSNSLSEKIRVRLEILCRNHMLITLSRKKYSATSGFHSGELMNRLFNDVQIITDGMTTILPSFVLMVTKGVGAVAVLFALSPIFTCLFLVGGLLIIGLTAIFRTKMKTLHKRVQQKAGVVRSYVQEVLSSLLVVKIYAAEKRVQAKASEYQEQYYKEQMKRRRIGIFAGAGMGFAFEMAYLVALLLGANQIMAGVMTYGTLTAILQLVGQVQQPFANLSGLLPKYYSMIASTERLMELEELEEEGERKQENAVELYEKMKGIWVDSLAFSYGENQVLHDTSFFVKKGDFVSISGLSGGGKTTLFLLLMGVYEADQGSLQLEFSDGSRRYLDAGTRSLFSWVPQGKYIFSGTLWDNIAFLKENVTEEQMMRAVRLACVDDFLDSLPDGLQTEVGERGFGLSEGQVQRVAIARALLCDAPILMLDEATSALDEQTELKVLENISSLSGKTCFIVTHRKAAIGFCNRHLVVKDGRVGEEKSGVRA